MFIVFVENVHLDRCKPKGANMMLACLVNAFSNLSKTEACEIAIIWIVIIFAIRYLYCSMKDK